MKNALKIFYVVPEAYPFAMTEDLALVASSYPKFIKNLGHDIRVMMPNYKTINERKYVLRDVIRLQELKIDLAGETHTAKGKSAFLPNTKVQIYFLDNKKYFDRDGLYGSIDSDVIYEDTAERFIFFAIGCLETLKLLYWQPDIIHCNDWQTALIPMLLKTLYKDDSFFKNTRTLLTVYNTNRIGEFPIAPFKSIGLRDEVLGSQEKLLSADKFSFLYSGLQYADIISVGHSKLGSEFENTVKKLGRSKSEIPAIAPQIDTQVWNPEEDKLIPQTYDAQNPDGKAECKQKLAEEYGLKYNADIPLFAAIVNAESNIDIKLLQEVVKNLLKLDVNLLIGCTRKNQAFKLLHEKCENSDGKCKVKVIFDEASLHIVLAGADVFLQPVGSQNGIVNSAICLAYGAIPIFGKNFNFKQIATKGDLAATEDLSSRSKSDVSDLMNCIKEVLKEWNEKEKWQQLVSKAMSNKFSWETPAQEYVKLCQKIAHAKSSSFQK